MANNVHQNLVCLHHAEITRSLPHINRQQVEQGPRHNQDPNAVGYDAYGTPIAQHVPGRMSTPFAVYHSETCRLTMRLHQPQMFGERVHHISTARRECTVLAVHQPPTCRVRHLPYTNHPQWKLTVGQPQPAGVGARNVPAILTETPIFLGQTLDEYISKIIDQSIDQSRIKQLTCPPMIHQALVQQLVVYKPTTYPAIHFHHDVNGSM